MLVNRTKETWKHKSTATALQSAVEGCPRQTVLTNMLEYLRHGVGLVCLKRGTSKG